MEVLLSYKFGNKYFVELKRSFYQADTPKHKRLSCLWIDYDTDTVTKLNFVSMKEDNGVITREFKEGTLIVTKNSAQMNFASEEFNSVLF